jgi:hypothetical protein
MDSHLGPAGYIRAEADLANVQPQYRGVPEVAAALLANEAEANAVDGRER